MILKKMNKLKNILSSYYDNEKIILKDKKIQIIDKNIMKTENL